VKSKALDDNFIEQKIIRPVYLFLLFFMGLTGFAQMPIFKRYYIADIPGLGWLAQFYVTHAMHYIGAICLLIVIFYSAAIYLRMMRRLFHLTIAAYINIVLLGAIVSTGIFRVLKNLPDVVFSPGFTMFIDISHLGFMLALMFFGILTLATKSKWLKPA
jgi:hypothetical protein